MLEWLFGEKMSEPEPVESPVRGDFPRHLIRPELDDVPEQDDVQREPDDDVVILLTRISKSIETNPDDWTVQLSGDWGNQKMGMTIDSGVVSVRVKFGGEKLTVHTEYSGGPRRALIEKIRSQTDALSARRMVEKLKKLEDQG